MKMLYLISRRGAKRVRVSDIQCRTPHSPQTPLSMLIAVLVFLCVFATSALASGVLVDAKGTITVTMPNGKRVAAKTGLELPDGTKVSAAASSGASVMLMDGSIAEIGAKQDFTVGKVVKSAGRRTVIEGIALAMNEATAAGSGPTVHGMVKMTQLGPGAPKARLSSIGSVLGPQGTYPVETTIELPAEITFEWRAGTKFNFANPVIVIEDSLNKKILIRKIAPSKSVITIKTDDLRLANGASYSWYFASDEKGKIMGKSRRFNFAVLSASEKRRFDEDKRKVETLQLSDDARRFLVAQLYFRARMMSAMVKTLLPLWEKDHADAVKKLLFLGYTRMGLSEEARKFQ